MTIDVPGAAAAAATPTLAFAGSWLGGWLSRRTARELDQWRRREETMRLLRWASELAVDEDDGRIAVGLATLRALLMSEMLQAEDLEIVGGVTDAALSHAREMYLGYVASRTATDVEVQEVGGDGRADN